MTSTTNNDVHKIASYFKIQPIVRACLFGSYARGEETDTSDVDILVDCDKSQSLSLLKICGMMIDLEDMLGKRIDLVENGQLKDFAVDSVNKNKILIYERSV